MSSLNVEQCDGVGHITLNRFGALNALSREFCHEIDVVLRDLETTENVRAILISSALKHFCAGADIREMAEITAEEAVAGQFTGCVSSLPNISKPVVVAVKGLIAFTSASANMISAKVLAHLLRSEPPISFIDRRSITSVRHRSPI